MKKIEGITVIFEVTSAAQCQCGVRSTMALIQVTSGGLHHVLYHVLYDDVVMPGQLSVDRSNM